MTQDFEPETVLELVAERLMESRDWSRSNPSHRLEWDPSNPDSQYSMVLEDAEIAINAVEEALDLFEKNNRILPRTSPKQGVMDPNFPRTAVTRQITTYIILGEYTEVPITVGDVRRWVDEVDSLGVDDDFSVEGNLILMYDEKPLAINSSVCAECYSEEDVLISNHTCYGGISPEHPSVRGKGVPSGYDTSHP